MILEHTISLFLKLKYGKGSTNWVMTSYISRIILDVFAIERNYI